MKQLFTLILVSGLLSCSTQAQKKFAVSKSDADWKKELTEEQYRVARQQGTEAPFHNVYWDNHEKGIYNCVACGQTLFSSDTKFESGTGWILTGSAYALTFCL